MNEHLLKPRTPTHDGALGLLERAIPLLQLLGDYIGNGPLDASRADSMGVRCDLLGDINKMVETTP